MSNITSQTSFLTPEANALNRAWTPKPGDECWFIKSMSQCIVEVADSDGTYQVRKLNGKALFATRAGLIPLAAFQPE